MPTFHFFIVNLTGSGTCSTVLKYFSMSKIFCSFVGILSSTTTTTKNYLKKNALGRRTLTLKADIIDEKDYVGDGRVKAKDSFTKKHEWQLIIIFNVKFSAQINSPSQFVTELESNFDHKENVQENVLGRK